MYHFIVKNLLFMVLFSQTLLAAEKVCNYSVDKKSVKFEWTGYKFTEKAPVSGTFKDIFWVAKDGKSVTDLISKLKFQIKTKSVSSGNMVRDGRIYKSFFKLMNNAESIEGYGIKYDPEASQSIIEVSMNNKRVPVAFKTTISKDLNFSLLGSVDVIKNFGMLKSFESISDLCKLLHTGKDGVAKTWSEVGLSIKGQIVKKCL